MSQESNRKTHMEELLKPKLKHPLCRATLKDGMPCQSVAVEDGMCKPHAKKTRENAAVDAEVAAKARSHRETSSGPTAASKMEEVPAAAEPVAAERIKSIRGALGEGLLTDQVAANIQELLLDGLRASKDVYSSCPDCGKRHPVSLPDLNTRVSAARAIMEEIEGRTKQISENADQRLEGLRQQAQKDLASLTDDELTLLIAAENDDLLPSMKEAARELAEKILADRNVGSPAVWLAENLSGPEAELLKRLAVAGNHWNGFPQRIYELAEEIVGATAPAAR